MLKQLFRDFNFKIKKYFFLIIVTIVHYLCLYIYILSDCNTIIPIYSTINFTNNTCIEIIDFQESNSRKLIYFIFKEMFYHQLRKNMISQLKCTHTSSFSLCIYEHYWTNLKKIFFFFIIFKIPIFHEFKRILHDLHDLGDFHSRIIFFIFLMNKFAF